MSGPYTSPRTPRRTRGRHHADAISVSKPALWALVEQLIFAAVDLGFPGERLGSDAVTVDRGAQLADSDGVVSTDPRL